MAGNQQITADGVLGVEDAPTRVFSFSLRSKQTGPGTVILRNGDATTDTEVHRTVGTADAVTNISFGEGGKFFPAGCFVDVDGDVEYVDIDYVTVNRP